MKGLSLLSSHHMLHGSTPTRKIDTISTTFADCDQDTVHLVQGDRKEFSIAGN